MQLDGLLDLSPDNVDDGKNNNGDEINLTQELDQRSASTAANRKKEGRTHKHSEEPRYGCVESEEVEPGTDVTLR
jgi:hypothetical protein